MGAVAIQMENSPNSIGDSPIQIAVIPISLGAFPERFGVFSVPSARARARSAASRTLSAGSLISFHSRRKALPVVGAHFRAQELTSQRSDVSSGVGESH